MLIKLKNFVKYLIWKHNNIGNRKTDYGTKLKLVSYMDYLCFKEIFIEKEYDIYIEEAIKCNPNSNNAINIFDLGANLGFFSIRCCEIIKRIGLSQKINFIMHEPSTYCRNRLIKNISVFNNQNFNFDIRNTLIGKKGGEDWFIEDKEHHLGQGVSQFIENKPNRYSRKIRYQDITRDLNNSEINLLKCDIEGSEIEFIKSYSKLLKNVNAIIIESHSPKILEFVCNEMQNLGFLFFNSSSIDNLSDYNNLFFIRNSL